jgi:hypothetical protein
VHEHYRIGSKTVLKELEDEPLIPFVVTIDRASAKKPALNALEATFGPIPYYPTTHPEGHIYIHPMQNERRTPEEIYDNVNGFKLNSDRLLTISGSIL